MHAPNEVSSDRSSAPRLYALPAGRCFLALPAHAAPGEPAWLTRALGQMLPRHDNVLILLEAALGDIGGGVASHRDAPEAQDTGAPGRAMAQTMSRWQEVDAVRRRLERAEQSRVQLAVWSHFTDASFDAVRRQLLTAFGVNGEFRADVLRLWVSQQRLAPTRGISASAARNACLREIEALAIRLRVGELSGYHVEYGRTAETILTLRLYAGSYVADGLTVEALVGSPARRVYRRLD
jgi:hypothetical protein